MHSTRGHASRFHRDGFFLPGSAAGSGPGPTERSPQGRQVTVALTARRPCRHASLAKHFATARPVDALVERSGLTRRSLERRFCEATGCPPIEYVQNLRMAEARRRSERTDTPVERIGFDVGYANTAFFRRLFMAMCAAIPSTDR